MDDETTFLPPLDADEVCLLGWGMTLGFLAFCAVGGALIGAAAAWVAGRK